MNRGKREQGSGREAETPLFPFTPSFLRPLISTLLVALSAVWLYHRALGFAYFNDDPTGHFAWMEGQALWQFFAGSADYGYYRPVVFAVLRFSELLFGNATFPHNPVADHALLLLLHAANAAMVWLLARRLSGRDAWAASLVFAFVPFSYEAVAYVASLTHPLLVFWTLAALLLYGWGLAAGDGDPALDLGERLLPGIDLDGFYGTVPFTTPATPQFNAFADRLEAVSGMEPQPFQSSCYDAAAMLMLPVVLAITEAAGLNDVPYVMAVMMAASASFATPIGYQCNLMVYGPGGYRFSDFLRIGVPMNLLMALVTIAAIPFIWPLQQ